MASTADPVFTCNANRRLTITVAKGITASGSDTRTPADRRFGKPLKPQQV